MEAEVFRALTRRAHSKYNRLCAEHLHRRPLPIRPNPAIVSFTFDDFPRTALSVGGAILKQHGCVGTYYVSLGLLGRCEATGQMFTSDDLSTVYEEGHELGCHTYAHCDAGTTAPRVFFDSVVANRRALTRLFPSASFRSFSFPKSTPCPGVKKLASTQFDCCRGGGQSFNAGVADLNHLRAYFLEQANDDIDAVRHVIRANRAVGGWLIFATHDICERPSRFGCDPAFFKSVVRCAVESGAAVLSVSNALARLRDGNK